MWYLGTGRNVRLLNTGDFDGDGKDEFAVMHYIPGTGIQASLVWYDGGTNASQGQWTKMNSTEYGAMFLDMATGDFNADGADDLVMVRNVNTQRLVVAWNVRTRSTIAEGSYSRPWYTVAGGKLSTSVSGDQISLTRDGGNAQLEGLILFKVVSGAFTDLATNSAWKWNPDFTSLSNGDLNGDGDNEVVMLRADLYRVYLPVIPGNPVTPKTSLPMANPADAAMNPFEQATGYGSTTFKSVRMGDTDGDGDDEVVMLRDLTSATTSLLVVNPAGAAMLPFEQATGYGSAAFKIVRTGDTDGDGKAEIVILKPDRYRIYTEPDVDSRATETVGSFYTALNASPYVSNLPFMALANVDGPRTLEGPTLGVTPTSLSFSLDCGDISPFKPLSITNTGTGSSFAWQAQAIEDNGSGWLLLDTTSGTTPGTVNVSVRPSIAHGSYTGKVRITTTDPAVQNKTVDVPVSYASQCSGFVASPSILNFNVPWGSSGSQSVTIGSAGPTPWTAPVVPVSPTVS